MALVSKRFRTLCVAPQLLRRLCVRVRRQHQPEASEQGSIRQEVLPRSAAQLEFLAVHAAPHVQKLDLDVHYSELWPHQDVQWTDAHFHELAANVAGALAVCAAAGQLRHLRIDADTRLATLAWLPLLRQLQSLELGNPYDALHLPAGVSRLTALVDANLKCALHLEGPLPPNLTQLRLENSDSEELPRKVGMPLRMLCIGLRWRQRCAGARLQLAL